MWIYRSLHGWQDMTERRNATWFTHPAVHPQALWYVTDDPFWHLWRFREVWLSKSVLQKCMKKERNQESSLFFLTLTRASLVFWSSYFKSWPLNQRGTGCSGSIMTPHDKHIHPRESNFPTPGLTCAQMLTSFGWSTRVELPKSDGCVMVYCRASPQTLVWSWKFEILQEASGLRQAALKDDQR